MNKKRDKDWLLFRGLLVVVIAIVIIIAVAIASNSASFQRSLKSTVSNYTGGLNRTVTVYDYEGDAIESWTGKFDISETENEVFFDDEDGKRVIIQNGIVIVEEN